MRFLFAVVLCLVLSTPAMAQQPAAATTQPHPAQPAQPAQPLPAWLQYHTPYQGKQNDLSNPHRTPDEIMSWAQRLVVELLSMNPGDYGRKFNEYKKYFLPTGWNDYGAYMQNSHLLNMVTQQGYTVSTIVEGEPMILNKGALGGTYHWLVQVPVVTSLYIAKPGSSDTQNARNARFNVVIQVGRVKKGADDNNISIESWSVRKSGTSITNMPAQ